MGIFSSILSSLGISTDAGSSDSQKYDLVYKGMATGSGKQTYRTIPLLRYGDVPQDLSSSVAVDNVPFGVKYEIDGKGYTFIPESIITNGVNTSKTGVASAWKYWIPTSLTDKNNVSDIVKNYPLIDLADARLSVSHAPLSTLKENLQASSTGYLVPDEKYDFTSVTQKNPIAINSAAISAVQQQVLDQWKALGVSSIGGGISTADRAWGLAERLVANKITDPSKLKLVEGGKTETGVDEYGNTVTYDVPQNYLSYNGRKIGFIGDIGTAEAWQPEGYLQPGNLVSWGAQGEGAVSYTAKTAPGGQALLVPSWGSTSDWGSVAPILAIASIIPSPIQPFAQALNAYGAYEQGNTIGAVLGALGAAYSFGAEFGTIDPSSAAYVNSMDAASDAAAGASASTFTNAANWLAANAGTIKTTQQAVALLNALDKKDLAGIIAGITQIMPQVGISISPEVIKPIQMAALGAAVSKGDWVGASFMADSLLGTGDTKMVIKGLKVANSVQSGDPVKMLSSVMDFNNSYQVMETKGLQEAAKSVGLPMTANQAKTLMESSNWDKDLALYKAQVDEANKVYKEQSGSFLPDSFFETTEAKDLAQKANDLYTTKDEAKTLWEKELGYKPSEFDLMEITGLASSDAKSIIDDKSSTTYDEAEKFLKDLYGDRYTPTKDEITSLMGLKEIDAEKQAGQQYNTWVDDRNTVTNDELTNFLNKAGLKEEDLSESQLLSALKTTEAGAETYLQRLADQKATTFDGEKYNSQVEAQNAAIKNGYNTYTWDGKSYTLMSPDQARQLQADRAAGKNVGVSPDIIVPIPGKTLKEQLAEAGNPDEYAYQQGDTIVVVSKRLAVPDYNNAEAWAAFKAEKDALGGDNFQSYLTEKFSILEQAMKGAPEGSVAKMAASAAMWGYGKVANLAQTMMRTAEAAGMSPNTAGIRIANQVEGWSKKLADQGVQNAEAAVFANIAAVTKDTVAAAKGVPASQISDAELYYEKGKALLGQVKDNPLGVGLFVGGEMIQEVPFLAASGGVGRVFTSVAGKTVGMSAALGTDVVLNGAESFGGNYGEVKDYLMKRGVPEDKAHALAVTSGLEAMGVSMVTSYVGDRQLVRAFVGDIAKDSFAKLALTTSTKEWLLGNVEGYLQNASAQIGKYGEFKSQDEAMNAGIMEGLAQKGLATGVLTAEKLSQVVAKDKDGNDVTYKDIISGSKTFDPTTINKSFSFGEGLNLGDAIGYHSTFTTNPDITPEEYFSTANFFRSEGLEPTAENVAAVVGGEQELSGEALQKAATAYADLNYVTASEAAQLLQDYGYQNPTQEQINQFVGAKAEADVAQQAKDWAAQNIITQEEAEEVLKNLGYPSPPKEMVDALVGQYAQSELESRAGKYKIATAGDVAGLAADVQAKYDALTADQKALADALAKQGIDLNAAIDAASQQAQQQVLDLGTTLNTRIDELVSQGKTQYEATQQAISELGAQNVELQGLIGTQARQATQQDIDALTSMLSGQQAVDLAYDVTGDKQITQADIDLLNRIVAGQNQDWIAPAGSPWAATGLYGQLAEAEAKRQADLKAAEAARQADLQAQLAREQEAARQAAIRTTAGQAQTQIQGLIGQLPQAYKALQETTTPIYAGEIKPFDFESPLDVGFLSPSKEKQTSQPGQQATKIASGGYLDDLLNLLR